MTLYLQASFMRQYILCLDLEESILNIVNKQRAPFTLLWVLVVQHLYSGLSLHTSYQER